MGKHRTQRHLAPTAFFTAITSCGVLGVLLGPAFVRPSVEFGPSVDSLARAGGQAVAVEHLAPSAPAPASGARSVPDTAERALPTEPPLVLFPRPSHSPKPSAAVEDDPPPAPSYSPAPVPSTSPTPLQNDQPTYSERGCRSWSK
jgi:hypothetical protein